jgi:hypothetical protein
MTPSSVMNVLTTSFLMVVPFLIESGSNAEDVDCNSHAATCRSEPQ